MGIGIGRRQERSRRCERIFESILQNRPRVLGVRRRHAPRSQKKKAALARPIANHAKHIIIDDVCYYIGSQNLYVCDLAEWGVVIDCQKLTQRCIDQYWKPMWAAAW